MKTECYHYRSPIGIIEITALESAILKLQFVNEGTRFATQNSLLQLCHNQLDNYFNGINEIFDRSEERRVGKECRTWRRTVCYIYY